MYLRQGNIVFSRDFVDTLKDKGVVLTRKNIFKRSGIVINHGNTKPIKKGRKVRELYLLNQPEYIKYCSNKLKNYNILEEFYPHTTEDINDVDKFPVLVKPLNGHHGYGIKRIDDMNELSSYFNTVKGKHLIQEYIPIKHEYRFNILDKDVFQVSHKQRIYNDDGTPMKTDKGGMVFSYRSLGSNAKISDKFWDYINRVILKFHNSVGNHLADYCIDVIKGKDNTYYLSEINSAYGIGHYTSDKLIETINNKYISGELDKYMV